MKANVLIVDDRPENLLALRAILEPLGCHFLEAHSGIEALKQLLRQEVALILMDVQMPNMDGFETASLIKGRDKTSGIPIIFITALSKEREYMFRGYSAGAVDYISKPFDPDILRSKVAIFIELWNKTEQIKQQAKLLQQVQEREKERELRQLEDALERKRLSELAQSQRKLSQFKSTLDATLDIVLIFEAESLRYTYANQGASACLGYSYDEMLELQATDLKPLIEQEVFRAMIEPLRSGELEVLRFETQHLRRDGSFMPAEVYLQFIQLADEDGRFISISRDISERKRAEQALIEAKENAEAANRAKSDFLAGVSHELRTPLNAILGFSKLLFNPRVGPLNEDQNAYLQDVVSSAEHLLQLINDILDLSKIEAGKMTLDCEAFDFADLVERSLIIVREAARERHQELVLDLPAEVRELQPLRADARKIKQVMYNLLSNAVKFTPANGKIEVAAFLENEKIVVSVRDSGVGIAPEHQKRIFDAFEQVDGSYTRQEQGTGLGLALTKRIVELHGGELKLQSEIGQGSTFSFCLPL